MGTYKSSGTYVFEMPPQDVPKTPLARGRYRLEITYTADNHAGVLREEKNLAFVIV